MRLLEEHELALVSGGTEKPLPPPEVPDEPKGPDTSQVSSEAGAHNRTPLSTSAH